jgi:hypothetical protein
MKADTSPYLVNFFLVGGRGCMIFARSREKSIVTVGEKTPHN